MHITETMPFYWLVTSLYLAVMTFWAWDTDIPKSEYQSAIEAWLQYTGRSCVVTDGYKLVRPQWEFKYRC